MHVVRYIWPSSTYLHFAYVFRPSHVQLVKPNNISVQNDSFDSSLINYPSDYLCRMYRELGNDHVSSYRNSRIVAVSSDPEIPYKLSRSC